MGFSVYLQQGKTPIRIRDMEGKDTVQTLIDKLKKKINSTKLILCIFNSVALDPTKTLNFYGIKRHSYIQYSERYKGGQKLLE